MRLRNIPGAKAAITGSSYVVQNPEEWKGKWKQCFTKEQPLHIEVGMGKGRFLMDMASLHPEINYVGVEMYDSVPVSYTHLQLKSRQPVRLQFLQS